MWGMHRSDGPPKAENMNIVAGPARFELTTSGATGRCSIPLNYNPTGVEIYFNKIAVEFQGGNSSSGLVTLGLMLLKPAFIGLGRSQVFQGLMRTDVVVDSVPFLELTIMGLDARFDVLDLIKLFPVRPVRPFDVALQLRRARRDDEQADPARLAGLFEVALELRSAVDLDRPDREGELLFHVFQEEGGREARGPMERPAAVPTGNGISSAELEADHPFPEADLDGVDLH
jgi:hypothetical protein